MISQKRPLYANTVQGKPAFATDFFPTLSDPKDAVPWEGERGQRSSIINGAAYRKRNGEHTAVLHTPYGASAGPLDREEINRRELEYTSS